MAKITYANKFLYVSVTVRANDQELVLPHMVIDTGSAATLFRSSDLEKIGIFLPMNGIVKRLRGIGGSEFVIEFPIPYLTIDDTMVVEPFTIHAGAVNYGYNIDGFIGLDFLLHVQATLDLPNLEVRTTK